MTAATSGIAALDGLQVLRVGDCAASAFCAQLMVQMGATITTLRASSSAVAFDGSAAEARWFGLDRVDGDAGDPEALARALATADVLIDARAAGADAPEALSEHRLAHSHPHLIRCRITPFGEHGPYSDFAASDITLYAMSGLMQTTGDGGRAPLKAAPRIVQVSAGLYAAIACLLALRRRETSGQGERIELSMQEAAMQNAEIALADHLHSGKVARRNGDEHAMVPWRCYPCADGEAFICGGPTRNWPQAVALIGDAALAASPFLSLHERLQHRQAFEAQLRPWLTERDRTTLFHAGQRCGLAWAPLLDIEEALADPQHAARSFFEEDTLADGGKGLRPSTPFHRLAASAEAAPAPAREQSTGTDKDAPLAGVRVVDFTHDWAGPHAARLLAEQGAEVIKIEYPERLDGMRGGYPERINDFARFWQLHRNKRSVTLDLKKADDLALCRQIIADSDLVLENSRPGVMQRLGLDYESLRALREDIILVSLSAFGASGPYADYAGYGGGIEAISGLQSLTGYETDGPRYRVREMDVINGIFGAAAAAATLLDRQRSRRGQWIELSETESCCWAIGEYFLDASSGGNAAQVRGNRHATYAPQGCYACLGEDRWLTLSVADDEQWRALTACIDATELAEDPRLGTVEGRQAAHDAIDARVAQWCAGQDAEAAMRTLQSVGVPAGVVMNAADLAADPHLEARQWFLDCDDTRLPGLPFHLAHDGEALWRRGPALGEDNAWLTARYPGAARSRALDHGVGTAFDLPEPP